MKMKTLKIWEYFKRGHSAYFSYALQLFNFLNIIFLALITLELIKPDVSNYILLVIIVGLLYFPIAIIIGFWDYRSGGFIALSEIVRENSPIYQEIFERLEKLEEK